MIDLIVRDTTKPPHDKDFLDFIVLKNEQWEKVKQYIEQLKEQRNGEEIN